jgi:hypothetical protein
LIAATKKHVKNSNTIKSKYHEKGKVRQGVGHKNIFDNMSVKSQKTYCRKEKIKKSKLWKSLLELN